MQTRTEVMGIEVLAFARLLLFLATTFAAGWAPGSGSSVAGEGATGLVGSSPAPPGGPRRLVDEGDGWRGRAQPGYPRAGVAPSLSHRPALRHGARVPALGTEFPPRGSL